MDKSPTHQYLPPSKTPSEDSSFQKWRELKTPSNQKLDSFEFLHKESTNQS